LGLSAVRTRFEIGRTAGTRTALEMAPGKVRLVLAEKGRGRPTLVGYGEREVAVRPGEPGASGHEGLAEVLDDLFRSLGAPRHNVGLVFSHVYVFLRQLALPRLSRREIDRTVGLQAEAAFPVSTADLLWDYELARASDTGRLEVLLVGIQRALVQPVLACLEGLKVRPAFLDAEPLALFRACIGSTPGDNAVLLNIGANGVSLHVYGRGWPVRYRAISYGEGGVRGLASGLEQVRNSLAFWELAARVSVSLVHITGELASEGQVRAMVGESLGVEVAVCDPLRHFVLPAGAETKAQAGVAGAYSVPLGVLLRRRWR